MPIVFGPFTFIENLYEFKKGLWWNNWKDEGYLIRHQNLQKKISDRESTEKIKQAFKLSQFSSIIKDLTPPLYDEIEQQRKLSDNQKEKIDNSVMIYHFKEDKIHCMSSLQHSEWFQLTDHFTYHSNYHETTGTLHHHLSDVIDYLKKIEQEFSVSDLIEKLQKQHIKEDETIYTFI